MADFWAPAAALCNPPCGPRIGPDRKQSGSGGVGGPSADRVRGPRPYATPLVGPEPGPIVSNRGLGGPVGPGAGAGVHPGRLSVSRSGGCQPALRFPSPRLSEAEAGDIFEGPPRARPHPWGVGRSQMPVANKLNTDSMVERNPAPIYLRGIFASPPIIYSTFGRNRFSASPS